MKNAIFLLFPLIFLSCSTSVADVITLNDGSVFEGELGEKKEAMTWFKVVDGTVGIGNTDIVSIEDRKPTADEKARLISFKTERYDVTIESFFVTPFEEELMDLYYSVLDQDIPSEARVKVLAEKFNLPPIIVQEIIEFKVYLLE
ncbi:MAG: hypothetical protein GY800_12600 [Planctomycetes bacterium]|nr:hypothetical protein [Planctomycetota bacterium]